jgi:hypothetical protein
MRVFAGTGLPSAVTMRPRTKCADSRLRSPKLHRPAVRARRDPLWRQAHSELLHLLHFRVEEIPVVGRQVHQGEFTFGFGWQFWLARLRRPASSPGLLQLASAPDVRFSQNQFQRPLANSTAATSVMGAPPLSRWVWIDRQTEWLSEASLVSLRPGPVSPPACGSVIAPRQQMWLPVGLARQGHQEFGQGGELLGLACWLRGSAAPPPARIPHHVPVTSVLLPDLIS